MNTTHVKAESGAVDFFHHLGLNKEEGQVAYALLHRGALSILEVSRLSEVNRTTVYRILEKLKEMGLVEEIVDEHRRLVRFIDASKLDRLVAEKESQTQALKSLLPGIINLRSFNEGSGQGGTKVLFYRGATGIKQMIWNVLRAKKAAVGYSYRTIQTVVGERFTKEWTQEWSERNLLFRDLISDTYIESKKEKIIFSEPHFESRYIPPDILNINHQMDLYNDVMAFYNWHEGEIFGVEIYNEKISMMHKQLFEIVWRLGKTKLP